MSWFKRFSLFLLTNILIMSTISVIINIQGVVNAFAMFLSRIVGFFVSKMADEKMEMMARFIYVIDFDILFSILGSILVAYFSRWREFKTNAGGLRHASRGNMIAALDFH